MLITILSGDSKLTEFFEILFLKATFPKGCGFVMIVEVDKIFGFELFRCEIGTGFIEGSCYSCQAKCGVEKHI